MARTKPSSKAKQRAESLKSEVALDASLDPEMRGTLNQERSRRVGFKKVGEATTSATYPTKESVTPRKRKGILETLTEGFKQFTTSASDAEIARLKPKIEERKATNAGARIMKRRGGR